MNLKQFFFLFETSIFWLKSKYNVIDGKCYWNIFYLFYFILFKFEARVRPLPGPILKLSPLFEDWKSKRRSDLFDEFCRLDIRTGSSIPNGVDSTKD
jgi:hypothetical protein